MRFLAGAASAGHKQAVNTVISCGYDLKEQRAANLSGNNAGVIGGILCGMGLAAQSPAYSATERLSAAGIGTTLYLAFTSLFILWKLFEENAFGRR